MFIMFQYLPQKTAEIPELHPQRSSAQAAESIRANWSR